MQSGYNTAESKDKERPSLEVKKVKQERKRIVRQEISINIL